MYVDSTFIPTNTFIHSFIHELSLSLILLSQHDIINQSRRSDPRGHRHEHSISHSFLLDLSAQFLRRHRVRHAQIIQLEPRFLSQSLLPLTPRGYPYNRGGTQRFHVAFSLFERCAERTERLVERGRGGAFLCAEIRVSRGESESVAGADDGTDRDVHGDVQVADELLHHNGLQTVLLAKVGVRGLHDVEQFGYHGRDSAEETRTGRSFADAVASFDRDVGKVLGDLRVHHFVRRSEHRIATNTLNELAVVFKSAGVGSEIFVRSKLLWIHKDTGHHKVIVLTSLHLRWSPNGYNLE